MSTARRAYDLLRGYVNQEWDRVKDLEMWDAIKELESPVSASKTETAAPTTKPDGEALAPEADQIAVARLVLGVDEHASFDDIRKAYERLNTRSDPSRFPEGSVERNHAAQLQRQVNIAYHKLTDAVPTTEKRFRSLEIE